MISFYLRELRLLRLLRLLCLLRDPLLCLCFWLRFLPASRGGADATGFRSMHSWYMSIVSSEVFPKNFASAAICKVGYDFRDAAVLFPILERANMFMGEPGGHGETTLF